MLSEAEELELLELERQRAKGQESKKPGSPFKEALKAVAGIQEPVFGLTPSKIPVINALAANPDQTLSYAKSFGKGALNTLSFNTAQKLPMDDSVTNLISEPNPKMRKLGQAAGIIPLIMGAQSTGGAAVGMGLTARGAAPVSQAVGRAIGTGLTYGAAEGGVQGLPINQTINNAVETGNAFGLLGAAGHGLGQVREVLGKNVPSEINRLVMDISRARNKEAIDSGAKTLGLKMAERAEGTGTAAQQFQKVRQSLSQLEPKVAQAIEKQGAKAEINISAIRESLEKEAKLYDRLPGSKAKKAASSFRRISEDIGNNFPEGKAPAMDAQEYKRELYNLIRSGKSPDDFLKSLRENPYEIQALRQSAAGINKQLMDKIEGLSATNKEYKVLLSAEDELLNLLSKKEGLTATLVRPIGEFVGSYTSRGLNKAFAEPSQKIAPAVRQLSRIPIVMPKEEKKVKPR